MFLLSVSILTHPLAWGERQIAQVRAQTDGATSALHEVEEEAGSAGQEEELVPCPPQYAQQ